MNSNSLPKNKNKKRNRQGKQCRYWFETYNEDGHNLKELAEKSGSQLTLKLYYCRPCIARQGETCQYKTRTVDEWKCKRQKYITSVSKCCVMFVKKKQTKS